MVPNTWHSISREVLVMPPIKKKKATKKKAPKKKAIKVANTKNKTAKKKKKLAGPVYGVPYIEVDFGQRDEGWSLYLDKAECIKNTKASSARGAYSGGGGYYGPERPLHYYEIPIEGLEEEYVEKLMECGGAHTSNHWRPKYKGPMEYIK